MKKLFSLSLAFYVLVLTFIPCVDKELCLQNIQQIQVANVVTDSHNSYTDSCSPFCHCSCCNISMEVASPCNLDAVYSSPQVLAYFVSPKIYFDFICSVWEPPKG